MSKMADQLREKMKRRPGPHEQLIMGNDPVDSAPVADVNEEPIPPKKKKPGPKVTYKMRKITVNIEEILDDTIDQYCADNRVKKSEFIRKTVYEKLKEFGYDPFSKEV